MLQVNKINLIFTKLYELYFRNINILQKIKSILVVLKLINVYIILVQ